MGPISVIVRQKHSYTYFNWITLILSCSLLQQINFCAADDLIVTREGIYENAVAILPQTLQRISNHIFNGSIPDKVLDFYAPVNAKSQLCKNESKHYKKSFQNFEPWALQMWDSSGKIPAGMLHLNLFELGNFPGCLELAETAPYDIKYCLIRFGNWAGIWDTGYDWANKETIFYGSARIIKPEFYLARCVPASCSNDDLIHHFSDYVSPFNFSVKLDKFSCTGTYDDEPYTFIDWFMIAFGLSTLFLIIFTGALDFFLPKEYKTGIIIQYLFCFSSYTNAKKVLTRADPTRSLRVLNGLRASAMILIMWGHMAANLGSSPKINAMPLILDHYKPSLRLAFAGICNKAVDVFFVLSGLLITYMFLHYRKCGKKFSVVSYYINRIIRIVPPYAVQIGGLITILYRYTGSGPMWKHNWGMVRDTCIKNWWTNLLFVNNIIHRDEMCIATNWYLAVDTQLYVVAPLIFFPLIKSENFRKFGIPLVIVFFDTFTFYTSYINEYRAGALFEHDMRTERTNASLYTATYGRVGCWVLGLYLGYYLHTIDLKNPKKISKPVLWVCWTITLLMPLIEFCFMMYFMSNHVYVNIIHALYHGYSRSIYGASICWLILACELGYGGIFYKILSSYPMQILGRITFSTYLVQEAFLYGIDSLSYTISQYNSLREYRDGVANIIFCFGLAFIYHIAFEAPYINLGKLIIGGVKKPEPSVMLTQKTNGVNGVNGINGVNVEDALPIKVTPIKE